MEQLKCVNSACDGTLTTDDLFCGSCGTPAPWPGTAPRTSGTLNGSHDAQPGPADGHASFFGHAPRRQAGPLSNATRYLCAAAYLDPGFANRVIDHLIASRRAVAPSLNCDIGPVIRHCLRARKNILIRDLALTAIVLLALFLSPLPTIDFLLITFVLGVLLPGARTGSRGLVARLLFAVGLAASLAVIGLFSFLIVIGTLASAFVTGGSLGSSVVAAVAHEFEIGVTFVILLALTWGAEFAYNRTTFRTLIEHLRLGAPPPWHTSSAAEARIAMVEGAQWGNVTLYEAENPFIGTGLPLDQHWSIAIKLDPANPARQVLRRPAAADGYVPIDPVELHQKIRECLLRLNDPGLPVNERVSGLTVTDRLVGSGTLDWTSPLVDKTLMTPYSQASQEAIEALICQPQAGLRYFQQVSVNDEGPPVMSGGQQVLDGVDQGIAVSAFVYAVVEGRMFYLQFILTALPPILRKYQIIDRWPSTSSGKFLIMVLLYSLRHLFSALAYSPVGIYAAFRLWRRERRQEREGLSYNGSATGDLGTRVSVRELGTADRFGSYIRERDVEKYEKIIQRMLLETVQDFLAAKGVDTSAFEGSANVINGDVISVGQIMGHNNQVGKGNIQHQKAGSKNE
jgi:hypothetical protein